MKKYRGLFESSRDAIFISTPQGKLVDVNPAAVELFGYSSRDELLSADVAKELYQDPADRERGREALAAEGFVEDLELSLRTKQGRKLTVLETATAIRNEAGEVIGYRGILRDVTERRSLMRQLQQSQKMEAIARLAGGVAHDFNNLLTAVIGYADLMIHAWDQERPPPAELGEIRRAGTRAAGLVRQLLAYTRQQVLRPRTLDLNRVVSGVDRLLQRCLGESVELVIDLEEGLRPVRADPGQIEQILLNLAVNARDAMPEGGTLSIETRGAEIEHRSRERAVMPPGAYVLLRVRDTGHGMDEATLEKAFDPFFTTKPDTGTGLGLSTVYGIVKQSGGFIWVDSTPGEGAVFETYFPAADGPVLEPRPPVPRVAEEARGTETVLVAEDDPLVAELAERILTERGYRVLLATDPERALELCEGHDSAIDLLLTDVVLPGMSGLELARRVRRRIPGVRILTMSGYTREQSLRGGGEGERPHFIGKPFSPAELGEKVRQVLDGAGD